MNNKALLGLVGVTVLLLVVALVIDSKNVEAPVATTETEVATSSVAMSTEVAGESLTTIAPVPPGAAQIPAPRTTKPVVAAPQSSAIVLPQLESGSIVTVSSARLAKPGYIVIYRTNSQEKTELVGYSKYLPAGYYSNVAVQVTSGVVKKQVVTAVLHEDDGDEVFEFPASDFYLKNGGRLVYDEDVVDVPVVDEAGLINGTVEAHLEDAKSTYTGD